MVRAGWLHRGRRTNLQRYLSRLEAGGTSTCIFVADHTWEVNMGLVPNALSAYSYIWRLATIVPIALLAGVIGLYLAGYVATVFELEHIEKILLLVTWFFCSDYCLFDLRLVVAA